MLITMGTGTFSRWLPILSVAMDPGQVPAALGALMGWLPCGYPDANEPATVLYLSAEIGIFSELLGVLFLLHSGKGAPGFHTCGATG